jgi:uncharacterized integral membrane protein
MQCNIDAKGKAARLLAGTIMMVLALGGVVLVLLDVLPGSWGWPLVVAMGVMGAFAIYEGAAGWCALRAMGFRTRI